jgi:hypothetical protein
VSTIFILRPDGTVGRFGAYLEQSLAELAQHPTTPDLALTTTLRVGSAALAAARGAATPAPRVAPALSFPPPPAAPPAPAPQEWDEDAYGPLDGQVDMSHVPAPSGADTPALSPERVAALAAAKRTQAAELARRNRRQPPPPPAGIAQGVEIG